MMPRVPVLLLVALTACNLQGSEAAVAAQHPDAPEPIASSAPVQAPPSSATTAVKAGIPLDLSYVERRSAAFPRFKRWVDAAVSGSPGYAFSASHAALLHRMTGDAKYCDLAVRTVDGEVTEAEAAIAAGRAPAIAGDSYLEVGPRIADLSLTLDTCKAQLDERQRARWSAYAEQAVWNVWNHGRATWGGRAHPWTGWSVDNPGNNYFYSFVEATMYWALASGDAKWMRLLRDDKLARLREYYARLPGGGSLEGTGYGTAHMRLFAVYRLWRDATGEDLANASSHANDSIAYWVHATVPSLDRFAPIGDQSRNSIPELYDYHRRLMLEARASSKDPQARALAAWWLGNISVDRMHDGFNAVHDLLPAGEPGDAPEALVYHARGVGHVFARSGWDKDAMWLSFVAGPYNESHAHQEQGGFTLFSRGEWLAVTENIWSHSGIQQGTETNNVVRFERANPDARQCMAPAGDRIVHQCEQPVPATIEVSRDAGTLTIDADLTPVYAGNPALQSWTRRVAFSDRKLLVSDRFSLASGTRAVFQVNVPVEPRIAGAEAVAGRLRVRVLEPATATLSAHDWRKVDGDEFRRGWRLDVAGGERGYVVELSETD